MLQETIDQIKGMHNVNVIVPNDASSNLDELVQKTNDADKGILWRKVALLSP